MNFMQDLLWQAVTRVKGHCSAVPIVLFGALLFKVARTLSVFKDGVCMHQVSFTSAHSR